MLIFSVDTSGRRGSVALVSATANSFDTLEIEALEGGSYSSRLIPELSSMLARRQLRKNDLEGFVVVSGPGSFTGLRVGLSAIKGLAEVFCRPVATVSMLEAIAARAEHRGRVVAALDAGRNEVYAGEYDLGEGAPKTIRELLLGHAEFCALLATNTVGELVTPDPGLVAHAPPYLRIRQIAWPDAGEIARLGFGKILNGEIVSPEALEANYIRRSDAEIFSNARSDS